MYKHKYLKYKAKYLGLLRQKGGNFDVDRSILREKELLDEHENIGKESIFNTIEHIENNIFYDLPHYFPICEVLPNLRKGYIDIDIGKLYYEEEGNLNNPTIILLNDGPGCNHITFHPHFSKLSEKYRIIYYDPRGVGKSSYDLTKTSYTCEYIIKDLETIRNYFHINKWTIIGFSFGGFIAQLYAINHPETIEKMVLINSMPGMPIKGNPRSFMFFTQNERIKRNEIIKNASLNMDQKIFNMQLNGDWKRQNTYKPSINDIVKSIHSWQFDKNENDYNTIMSADSEKYNLTNKFNNFHIATLIIESEFDVTWNETKKDAIKNNHPNAYMIIFHKSNHDVFSSEPNKFFYVLEKFLENR